MVAKLFVDTSDNAAKLSGALQRKGVANVLIIIPGRAENIVKLLWMPINKGLEEQHNADIVIQRYRKHILSME